MSTKRLELFMGPDHAGTVNQLGGGKLAFEYNPRYAELTSATPISVSMPKQVPSHSDGQITPWLSGPPPRQRCSPQPLGTRVPRIERSPFSMLATPVGEDCPGAVRLIGPERVDALRAPSRDLSNVEWLTGAEVAKRLRDLKADNTAWLGTRHGGRFSLAGAQAKTALLWHPENGWGAPHGSTATTHILKPAIEGLDDHDLNEHLCLSAMRIAGLRAVRSRIQRFEDQLAIVVTRYDRASVNGVQVRVHQEDTLPSTRLASNEEVSERGRPGTERSRITVPQSDASGKGPRSEPDLSSALFSGTGSSRGRHRPVKNYSLVLNQHQVRLAPVLRRRIGTSL